MPVNKKKAPGRPKKEFVSKKPKTKIKSGPGRPRKYGEINIKNQVTPAIAGFVAKSVDDSKRKDLIILLLFLLSFFLFLGSLYFTLIKEKKINKQYTQEIGQMSNIEKENIDYTTQETINDEIVTTQPTANVTVIDTPDNILQPTTQNFSVYEQLILDFYQAVNMIDIIKINEMTETHLKSSNIFKTYYSKNWLSKFSQIILAPKIVVSNIQEKPITTTNPNIKNFRYTLEYILAKNQQKIIEEWSTVLIKKGEEWKIGKLMCETTGCSTMPFFNPEKYKR